MHCGERDGFGSGAVGWSCGRQRIERVERYGSAIRAEAVGGTFPW